MGSGFVLKLRKDVGERYSALLRGMDVVTPHISSFNTSVYAQYTIQVENRDAVQAALKEQGIPTAIHYPVPLHMQPAFENREKPFPVAESLAKRVISLPMHPRLSEQDQQTIVKAISTLASDEV